MALITAEDSPELLGWGFSLRKMTWKNPVGYTSKISTTKTLVSVGTGAALVGASLLTGGAAGLAAGVSLATASPGIIGAANKISSAVAPKKPAQKSATAAAVQAMQLTPAAGSPAAGSPAGSPAAGSPAGSSKAWEAVKKWGPLVAGIALVPLLAGE